MILDTSFLIDLMKNEEEAVKKSMELDRSYESVSTTTVSVFELWQGIKNTREKEKIHTLLMSLGIFFLDIESAFLAGDILRHLVKKGMKIDPEDVMIAGITLKNKETLLTKNVKHFNRIPQLKIETY